MFKPWPENRFVRHLEGRGHHLRKRLRLGALEPLAPLKLIETYDNMRVLDLLALVGRNSAELAVAQRYSTSWSALAYREADGPWLITWNPWHAETRVRASLMEEVSHIVLGHRPTKMLPDPATGLPKRTFSPSKEKEAYGVAGAALVPYNGLTELLQKGAAIADIAGRFGVSEPLVQMRVNVTGASKLLPSAAGG